jgi:hypothetical protein
MIAITVGAVREPPYNADYYLFDGNLVLNLLVGNFNLEHGKMAGIQGYQSGWS